MSISDVKTSGTVTRLIGELNPAQPQIEAERSRFLHGLPSEKSYDNDKMADLFELYHNYLV